MAFRTASGVADGFDCRYSAATPATCGVAIDVPEIVFVAVVLVYHEEVMLMPGAKRSTQVPMFAHDGLVSVLSVALTVMAAATRAGEVLQAFWAKRPKKPLPAAMA